MKRLHSLLVIVTLFALASTAFGQAGTGFTISDGNVFFTQGVSPTAVTAGAPSTDFRVTGAAGTDHLFSNWWWYRVDGVDTRENAFNTQVGPTVVAGDQATRNYTFPAFSAVLNYDVNSTGATSGVLIETLTITPLTAGVLNIFNYADFFISGQDASDIVDFADPSLMSIRDTVTGQVMSFTAVPPATNFQACPFGTPLPGILTNAVIDNLNNTNTANTAGDRVGAYQWQIQMQPGQVITLVESFTIPEPATLGLMAIGALALIRRRN